MNVKQMLLQEKEKIENLIKNNVPNDQKDAEMALEQSKEVYYRALELYASESTKAQANKARDAEINRLLQERDKRIEKNSIIYQGQLDLINRILEQL